VSIPIEVRAPSEEDWCRLPVRPPAAAGRKGVSGVLVEIRAFQPSDEPSVILLWEKCDLLRPWNDPKKDIRRKLRVQPELFIVGYLNEELVATAMAGYEGHRGWINYLAVAPEHQGRGLGRAIMVEAERLLREAGCPKVNVQVRGTNTAAIGFYQRIGYRVDDVVGLGKRIEHDEQA
jgi:ribosomal protein S18 acetylase RimI-like enzyme